MPGVDGIKEGFWGTVLVGRLVSSNWWLDTFASNGLAIPSLLLLDLLPE